MKAHRAEVYRGPDSLGRYSYAVAWMADYHPGHPKGENRRAERWQHFFCVPLAGHKALIEASSRRARETRISRAGRTD